MKQLKIILICTVLATLCIFLWASQQKWFPHKEDHFENKQIQAILLTKIGPGNLLTVDKEIQDPTTIAWFRNQLNSGYISGFSGLFGTLLPVEVFIDDRGDVIAAAYCRLPEYRVCFIGVEKKDNGYVITDWNDQYGIRDKEYVQEMAKLSNIETSSSKK